MLLCFIFSCRIVYSYKTDSSQYVCALITIFVFVPVHLFFLIKLLKIVTNTVFSSRVKPLGECRVYKKSDKGK